MSYDGIVGKTVTNRLYHLPSVWEWEMSVNDSCDITNSLRACFEWNRFSFYLKINLSFIFFTDGFSSFRQTFPEWCEDDSLQNKEMESSRNTQTDQLMGLR